MGKRKVPELLNEALSMEYTQYICLVAEGDLLTALNSPAPSSQFKEMAAEELIHHEQIRQRIVAPGGEPITAVDKTAIARKLEWIIKETMEVEKKAIEN